MYPVLYCINVVAWAAPGGGICTAVSVFCNWYWCVLLSEESVTRSVVRATRPGRLGNRLGQISAAIGGCFLPRARTQRRWPGRLRGRKRYGTVGRISITHSPGFRLLCIPYRYGLYILSIILNPPLAFRCCVWWSSLFSNPTRSHCSCV